MAFVLFVENYVLTPLSRIKLLGKNHTDLIFPTIKHIKFQIAVFKKKSDTYHLKR